MQNDPKKKINFGNFPIIDEKKLPPKTLGPELFGRVAIKLLKDFKNLHKDAIENKISSKRSPIEVPFIFL